MTRRPPPSCSKTLKLLGLRVAIDDFGTGYSSLAHLRRFPIDSLKIDRSFVAAMLQPAGSQALIHTLVQLGKTLELGIVAEGIEQDEQLRELRKQECDIGQGFLFAQPLDADAVEAFVAASEARAAGADRWVESPPASA